MKRILISTTILLVCCIGCKKNDTDPERDASRRFVVLSDIHLMHPDLLVNEGKAFDQYNWEENKLLRESPDIFAAALEKAKAHKPDFLIVCGDMTKDGEKIFPPICRRQTGGFLGKDRRTDSCRAGQPRPHQPAFLQV